MVARTHVRTNLAAASRLTPVELVILGIVMLALVGAVILSVDRSTETYETMRVKVLPGDTLWALAERYPVDGYSTPQTADLLAEINGLDTSTIVAGVSLEVPAPVDQAAHVAMR